MRKSVGMFFTAFLVFFISAAPCFATGLNLVKNYPEEGSHSSPPTNLGIKLFFDSDVAAGEVREQNKSCFSLLDDEGKSVPLKVLYTDSDPSYILVIAEPEDGAAGLGSDREYRFEIAQELQSADGATLDAPEFITFRTRNTSMDMNINMALMGVMFVGMFVFSAVSMRRQAKKKAAADEKQKVNPYRIAKETGKSVAEVVAQEEKRKQKSAKKNTRTAGAGTDRASGGASGSPPADTGGRRVKHVKGPRPIAAAGSSYRSGRKAAAEKRAREAAGRLAKGAAKPKNKNSKNQKKR